MVLDHRSRMRSLHRRRQRRPTHVEPRLGTALDRVLELDGRDAGGLPLCCAGRPESAARECCLQKPARLVQVGQPIAIALPRRELEAVALGQLQSASQLSFRESRTSRETHGGDPSAGLTRAPPAPGRAEARLVAELERTALIVQQQRAKRQAVGRLVGRAPREPARGEIL